MKQNPTQYMNCYEEKRGNLSTKTQSNEILKAILLTQPRVQQLQSSFTKNL